MHPKYVTKIVTYWDHIAKFRCWLDIELANLKCWDPVRYAEASSTFNGMTVYNWETAQQRISQLEAHCGHEVEAFVQWLGEVYPSGLWHKGLASSDLVECWMAESIKQSVLEIQNCQAAIVGKLLSEAHIYAEVICNGLTHGQLAEPITWGLRYRHWLHQVGMIGLNADAVPGKISGAVGTSITVHPSLPEEIVARRRISLAQVSTQIVPRVKLTKCLNDVATLASSIEKVANDIRLGITLGIMRFDTEHVGSSSMPHKVNPYEIERVIGMCKMVNSMIGCVNATNADNWMERDLVHSCVEREFLPTIFNHLYYAMDMLHASLYQVRPVTIAEIPDRTWSSIKLADTLKHDISRKEARLASQNVLSTDTITYRDRLRKAADRIINLNQAFPGTGE